jgi:hypothetical protein
MAIFSRANQPLDEDAWVPRGINNEAEEDVKMRPWTAALKLCVRAETKSSADCSHSSAYRSLVPSTHCGLTPLRGSSLSDRCFTARRRKSDA